MEWVVLFLNKYRGFKVGLDIENSIIHFQGSKRSSKNFRERAGKCPSLPLKNSNSVVIIKIFDQWRTISNEK